MHGDAGGAALSPMPDLTSDESATVVLGLGTSSEDAFPADVAGAPCLVAVRHGETLWTLQRRHTGRTDIPLDEVGERQAEGLGRRLAGRTFAAVLTSPLARARETCALAGFGLVAQQREDLCEWDYGEDEGKTTAEICVERPGWSLWREGTPGGETLDDVARRAERVIDEVRGVGGDVLVFSHAHFLRVLAALWLGLDASNGARFVLRPASISVLGWEHDEPAILRWNDDGTFPLE